MDAERQVDELIPDPAIETGVAFLTALFAESDTILFRPVESWSEAGKKRSRVDYRNTCYRNAVPGQLRATVRQLLKLSAVEHVNVFFGACPRLGDKGRYDLAWQIRRVPALWVDIDHVTVAEASDRVAKACLPKPSITVNSGSGVHLYWKLDSPFPIDDAGDPPPVFIEWIEDKLGKKRGRRYIQEAGSDTRLYLDFRANVPELSAKALHAQDVLAGIAAAIGGDSTFDLARLLRVPGTWNRKNERNGQPPVPCELVEFEPDRKYPFSDFARFAESAPPKVQRQQIAAVRLPTPKPLTPTRLDKLNRLVNACAVAPTGSRSEADWKLVCTSIEKGWPKDEVWQAVASIGKFTEAGEAYFDRTWGKAELQTRESVFHTAAQGTAKKPGKAVAGRINKTTVASPGDDDETDLGLVANLAKLICAQDRFAQDEGGKLYQYRSGVYRSRGEAFVRAEVKRLCQLLECLDEWSSHIANEVVEFIRVDGPLLWDRPPTDVINVKNGLLQVATRKLLSHSPDHLSAVQLPVNYDPLATCVKIDSFVAQTFPEDATTLAYEIPAWLMTPDTSIQKAVLLIGAGGNGKSRYLRMVEAFLGKGSVSNLSLHRLEADKFACSRLVGKLANICPDLPTEHLSGTSIFKSITGGDPITGEYKFKDSFDFIPFSRLVFSANSPPRANDASEGFFDRWLVVPFDRRFRGEGNEIPADKLDAMLSDPQEQSGLLNRALDVLPRLRATGRVTEAESISRAFSEFHAATDPLSVWLDRQTVESPSATAAKRALITAFNADCEKHGRAPITERAFGLALKKLRPSVTSVQRTVGGKVAWCYSGISLQNDAPFSNCNLADSADSPNDRDGSLDSLDSRHNAFINLSHAREINGAEDVFQSAEKQDRAHRVNRVNPVNGDCPHELVEEVVDDRIRTSCRLCGKFVGFRPQVMDEGGMRTRASAAPHGRPV